MSQSVTLTLPYPPSVNHYWGTRGKARFIGAAGKAFRAAVLGIWYEARTQGFGRERVRVDVTLHPKDHRQRDIDNPVKALFDAMEHARVFENDSQIREMGAIFGEVRKGDPCVIVTIRALA